MMNRYRLGNMNYLPPYNWWRRSWSPYFHNRWRWNRSPDLYNRWRHSFDLYNVPYRWFPVHDYSLDRLHVTNFHWLPLQSPIGQARRWRHMSPYMMYPLLMPFNMPWFRYRQRFPRNKHLVLPNRTLIDDNLPLDLSRIFNMKRSWREHSFLENGLLAHLNCRGLWV